MLNFKKVSFERIVKSILVVLLASTVIYYVPSAFAEGDNSPVVSTITVNGEEATIEFSLDPDYLAQQENSENITLTITGEGLTPVEGKANTFVVNQNGDYNFTANVSSNGESLISDKAVKVSVALTQSNDETESQGNVATQYFVYFREHMNSNVVVSSLTLEIDENSVIGQLPTSVSDYFAGKQIEYWYDYDNGPTVPFDFGNTAITRNTILVPMISNEYHVLFISSGTTIDPVAVTHGNYLNEPADPTREGYSFAGWLTEDGEDFAFDQGKSVKPITSDTRLTAQWNPEMVNYSVAIWFEKPNLSYTPNPQSENGWKSYNLISSIDSNDLTFSGRTGEKTNISVDNLPESINKYFTTRGRKTDSTNSILKYGTPVYVKNAEIKGNGQTVINLYVNRTVYTYIFDLLDKPTNQMTIDGVTYTGGSDVKYSIQVKYQQDISEIFPVQGVSFATFSGQTLQSWARPSTLTWYSPNGFASVRQYLDESFISQNGRVTTYNLNAKWVNDVNVKTFRYFAEALPGQENTTKDSIVIDGITYIVMPSYNQTHTFDLFQKDIDGFIRMNNEISSETNWPNIIYYYDEATETYSETKTPSSIVHRCFFFKRTIQPLVFNMLTNDIVENKPSDKNLLFGETLEMYKPEDPTREGYTFGGWYLDADYMEKFSDDDWKNTFIPVGGITLFAKWYGSEFSVNFYNDKTTNSLAITETDAGTTTRNKGDYVKENDHSYTINSTSRTMENGDIGVFQGWEMYVSDNKLIKFPHDMPITKDIDLHAVWQTDNFTITYDLNGGTGSVEEINVFKYGVNAAVLDFTGATAPVGKVFVGWREEGTGNSGTLYTPYSSFKITKNHTLVAQYVDKTIELIKVTYHGNFENSPSPLSHDVPAGSNINAYNGERFATREHYTLKGWALEADKTQVVYTVDQRIKLQTSDLDLYAVWEEDAKFTVEYKLHEDSIIPDGEAIDLPIDDNEYYKDDSVTVEDVLTTDATTYGELEGTWVFEWVSYTPNVLVNDGMFDMPGENVVIEGMWKFVETPGVELTPTPTITPTPTPPVATPTPTPPTRNVVVPEPTPEITPEVSPSPTPETEVVEEDVTPEAAGSGCWIHWLMLLVTLVYSVYSGVRINSRKKDNEELEDELASLNTINI